MQETWLVDDVVKGLLSWWHHEEGSKGQKQGNEMGDII